MSAENVTYKALNSANVRIDNSVDAERVYNISANVNVAATNVSNMEGALRENNDVAEVLATFNSYDETLSVNYQNITLEEQQAVNAAINAFIEDVKAKVENVSPVSVLNQE